MGINPNFLTPKFLRKTKQTRLRGTIVRGWYFLRTSGQTSTIIRVIRRRRVQLVTVSIMGSSLLSSDLVVACCRRNPNGKAHYHPWAILVGLHIICPLAITSSKHLTVVVDNFFIGANTSNALRLLPAQGHGL